MFMMNRSSGRAQITLILGLVAGFALVFGIVYIFDFPAHTLGGVLIRLLQGLLLMMGIAFVAALLISWLKKVFRK